MTTPDSSVHQILFRLAARAPHLPQKELMKRVATGIANHFAAVTCSIHTDESGWAAVVAEPARDMEQMSRLDRARLETIEARLVKEAVAHGQMRSALDLENPDEVEEFLRRTIGALDIFSFPLRHEGTIRAVLVLYLSLESDPLRDADLHGLMATGGLLALADTAGEDAS